MLVVEEEGEVVVVMGELITLQWTKAPGVQKLQQPLNPG